MKGAARVLWGLLFALLLAVPVYAFPPQGSTPPAQVQIVGIPEVGNKLVPAAQVPAGSTCAWFSNAVQVSTSCVSYTVVSGDVGHTITLQITTNGRAAFAALSVSGTPTSTGTVGTSYTTFNPTITGGSGSNVCAYTGAFPPGIAPSGCALSGTPTLAGTYPGLRLNVTDSVGGSAPLPANPFTITVASSGGGGTPGTLDLSHPTAVTGLTSIF